MRMRWLKHGGTTILVGLMAALLCALPAGCGKKGPPRLPDVEMPAGVRNLAVALAGGDIVLNWTAVNAEKAEGVDGYRIYRAADPVTADVCEGCPILFKPVATVPMGAGEAAAPKMTYREAQLPGTRYRFKVVPVDAQGRLGPDSNIVAITTD